MADMYKIIEAKLVNGESNYTLYEIPMRLWDQVKSFFWINRIYYPLTVEQRIKRNFLATERKHIKITKDYKPLSGITAKVFIIEEIEGQNDGNTTKTN